MWKQYLSLLSSYFIQPLFGPRKEIVITQLASTNEALPGAGNLLLTRRRDRFYLGKLFPS